MHEAVKNLQEVEAEGHITPDADQSFLLVLQTKQQSKWLQQYGNAITCMDAINIQNTAVRIYNEISLVPGDEAIKR